MGLKPDKQILTPQQTTLNTGIQVEYKTIA